MKNILAIFFNYINRIKWSGMLSDVLMFVRNCYKRLKTGSLSFLKKQSYILLVVTTVIFIPLVVRLLVNLGPLPKISTVLNQEELLETRLEIEKSNKLAEQKLAKKTPGSYYLVINSSANEFSLYKGTRLVKKDKCSTGSYILLKNDAEQEWMFKTPKGEFRIRSKTMSPVWKKPDWAFVEEGLPVPSSNHHTRFEYGVLGDYALGLGDGYLIHGTLYQRFLGLPVTHGCIRLNDANLELVYNSLSIGSKVYIY